jgi:hypothetical protein
MMSASLLDAVAAGTYTKSAMAGLPAESTGSTNVLYVPAWHSSAPENAL